MSSNAATTIAPEPSTNLAQLQPPSTHAAAAAAAASAAPPVLSASPTAHHDLALVARDGASVHVSRALLAARAPHCVALEHTTARVAIDLSHALLCRVLLFALADELPVMQAFVGALDEEASDDAGTGGHADFDEETRCHGSTVEQLLPDLLDLAHGALALRVPRLSAVVAGLVRDAMFCAPRVFCRCFNVVAMRPDLLPGVDRGDVVHMLAEWPERFLGLRDRGGSRAGTGTGDGDGVEGMELEFDGGDGGDGEEEEDDDDDGVEEYVLVEDDEEHGRVVDLAPQAWAALLELWPDPSRAALLLQALYTWASCGRVLRRVRGADGVARTQTDWLPALAHGDNGEDPSGTPHYAAGREWEDGLYASALLPYTRLVRGKFVANIHNRMLIARDLARRLDRVHLGEKLISRFGPASGLL